MKKTLSRSEWWLLLAPIALLLIFGAWMSIRGRGAPTSISAPSPLTNVGWSRDGRTIYGLSKSKDGRVLTWLRWNAATGDLQRSFEVGNDVQNFDLSPNGRFAIVSTTASTRLIEATAGRTLWEASLSNGSSLKWTPQGALFRLTSKGRTLEWISPTTGKITRATKIERLLAGGKGFLTPEFSRDGKRVALVEAVEGVVDRGAAGGGFSRYCEVQSGGRIVIATWPDLKPVLKIPVELATTAHFARDGKTFYAVSHIKDCSQILATLVSHTDLNTRKTGWVTINDANSFFFERTFARDGQLLILSSVEHGFSVYSTRSGQNLGQFGTLRNYKGAGQAFIAHISPDGNRLLRVHVNNLEIFDLKSYAP